MHTLKIRAVGSSAGVLLPKELLAEMGVGLGDTLYATRAPDGAVRLTHHDDVFAEQMAVAEEVMREDRDILRVLAKR